MHRSLLGFSLTLTLVGTFFGPLATTTHAQTTQEVHPVIYRLDFDKNSPSINFNFFDNGYVIGPYEGSALVGLGSFIFTLNKEKEYYLIEDSAHLFIAKRGNAQRMVFGGGSIGDSGFSGYLGSGSTNKTLSVPGLDLKIASSMKGVGLAGADETSLEGTINEPADGSLSLAGNINVKASLSTGFTRQANAVAGAGSLDDATQLVVDYLESAGFNRADPIEVSIAGTTNGNRFTDTDGVFTVSLSRTTSSASTVSYTTSGTAVAGTDYNAPSGTVTIPEGDTSATVTIDVIASTEAGGSSTVILSLASITSGDELLNINPNNRTATITLANGSLASITATQNGSRSGNTNGQFTVTISPTSSSATTINYSTTGSATEGTDYTALTGTVIVPADTGSATIDVQVVPQPGANTTDTVIVTLDTVTDNTGVAIDTSNNTATVELIN
ncbi:MAG: Calx-beta domain-containing protein [Verrucomicrobiota bacterium]